MHDTKRDDQPDECNSPVHAGPHVITDPLDHSENANESPDVRIVPHCFLTAFANSKRCHTE
jgi:hypothetical protein